MRNALYIGIHARIEPPPMHYLFIHDEIPDHRRARIFDPASAQLNPLHGLTYRTARVLADALYTLYPQGENTLTVRNGRRNLLKALLTTTRLDKLQGDEEIIGFKEDLLASPVLKHVFCPKKDDAGFSLNPSSVIHARLNRAELGEFDALAIGLVLMALYKGQLVIPDFGFYGREAHTGLIRENRLIAGVRFVDELPLRLKRAVLLIKDKHAHGALYEDAVILAAYDGLRPDPTRADNPYNRFIDAAVAAPSFGEEA